MTLAGGMQSWPLRATSVLDHAATMHGQREIVSRMVEDEIHRLDYAALRARVRRCADALHKLGIRPGVRLTVLARNSDDTLTLNVENGQVPLGLAGAERVWVAT